MKKILIFILSILLSGQVFANYAKADHDPTVPKAKAHLVNSITKKLDETQAQILEDALLSLSLDHLKEINEEAKSFDEIFWGIYDRDPDDDNEQGTENIQ